MAGSSLRAAAWMSGSIVSFTAMAVAGREAGRDLDTFEIMFWRSLMGIVIVVGLAAATGALRQITLRHLGLQVVRNVSHFAGQNLWFYAITVAPLTQVFAMEFTMPLWVMLLALVVLGERLTPLRILVAAVGFAGVLIVTRPWEQAIGPGIIPAALAAVGFAGSAVFTKVLTRTETITCILFWLTIMQAVFGLVCAGWDGDLAAPTMRALPWVLVIGVAGLVAHWCLTKALSLAPATVVVPIDFTRLPIIAVLAMLLYDEPIEPAVFAGAALIFAANYLNIWSEARRARAAINSGV
jgi:drug/metabolite transporter (DMT)-like permease